MWLASEATAYEPLSLYYEEKSLEEVLPITLSAPLALRSNLLNFHPHKGLTAKPIHLPTSEHVIHRHRDLPRHRNNRPSITSTPHYTPILPREMIIEANRNPCRLNTEPTSHEASPPW